MLVLAEGDRTCLFLLGAPGPRKVLRSSVAPYRRTALVSICIVGGSPPTPQPAYSSEPSPDANTVIEISAASRRRDCALYESRSPATTKWYDFFPFRSRT